MCKCRLKYLALTGVVLLSGCVDKSQSTTVEMFSVSPAGIGATVGKIYIHPIVGGGIRLQPALHDLPAGELILQIHQLPSCAPGEQDDKTATPAVAAGNSDQPIAAEGDKSDMPLLTVDNFGIADSPVDVSQLTLEDLQGHSLEVHTGNDGSSSAKSIRIACGTVQLP